MKFILSILCTISIIFSTPIPNIGVDFVATLGGVAASIGTSIVVQNAILNHNAEKNAENAENAEKQFKNSIPSPITIII